MERCFKRRKNEGMERDGRLACVGMDCGCTSVAGLSS